MDWRVGGVAAGLISILFCTLIIKCLEFDKQIDLGDTLMREGRYAEALTYLKAAEGVAWRSHSFSDLARALDKNGVACQMVGNYLDGESALKEALAEARKAMPVDADLKARILFDLSQVYREEREYELAEGAAKEAIQIAERQAPPNQRRLADSLSGLGSIYIDQEKYSEAEVPLDRAAAINASRWSDTALTSEDDQDLSDDYTLLGTVYKNTGRIAKAEIIFKQALKMKQDAYGADNPSVAYCCYKLAGLSYDQDRYGDAEKYYKQAIAASTLDPSTKVAYIKNLGRFYCAMDRYEDAEVPLKEALALSLARLEQHNLEAEDCFTSLAELYDMWHRPAQAHAVRKQAAYVLSKALGPNHPAVIDSIKSLASHGQ